MYMKPSMCLQLWVCVQTYVMGCRGNTPFDQELFVVSYVPNDHVYGHGTLSTCLQHINTHFLAFVDPPMNCTIICHVYNAQNTPKWDMLLICSFFNVCGCLKMIISYLNTCWQLQYQVSKPSNTIHTMSHQYCTTTRFYPRVHNIPHIKPFIKVMLYHVALQPSHTTITYASCGCIPTTFTPQLPQTTSSLWGPWPRCACKSTHSYNLWRPSTSPLQWPCTLLFWW
jgi:hypothetical protein